MTAHLVLLVLALVCFLVATVAGFAGERGAWAGRANFVALGLALWVFDTLLTALH